MAQAQSIRGVLDNFLSTYLSRYTDHAGYWLFGQVLPSLDGFTVELLQAKARPIDTPIDTAATLAREKFSDQLARARIDPSRLERAVLTAKVLPGEAVGSEDKHDAVSADSAKRRWRHL